jgi:hypothetical protein
MKNKIEELNNKYGIDIENEPEFVDELLVLFSVSNRGETLEKFADWLQYNGKWSLPEQQAKDFLKEQQEQN